MFLTFLAFILIFGLLIFVHELGHFLTARRLGVKVEEFGFGFPPRIFGIRRKGTIYSINLVPLGGFVKIKGEEGEKGEEKDSFAHKKIYERGIILASGVLMNFFLAFVLFSIGFSLGLPAQIDETVPQEYIKTSQIQVMEVLKNSPAGEAGIKMGDVFLEIDGQKVDSSLSVILEPPTTFERPKVVGGEESYRAGNVITNISEIQDYFLKKEGQKVTFKIKRGNQDLIKEIIPRRLEEVKKPVIGVSLAETGLVVYPPLKAIWLGAKNTLFLTGQIIYLFGSLIKNLILQQKLITEIGGPVAIAVVTGQVVNLGFIYVLQFTALLSLNLAILNFIPFPALDGGRFLFLLIEKVRGKPMRQTFERWAHNIGFSLLLLLIFLVTYRDLSRFGGEIWGAFHKFLK